MQKIYESGQGKRELKRIEVLEEKDEEKDGEKDGRVGSEIKV